MVVPVSARWTEFGSTDAALLLADVSLMYSRVVMRWLALFQGIAARIVPHTHVPHTHEADL